MKGINRILFIILAITIALCTPVVCAPDWPQFLGAENAQGTSEAMGPLSGNELALRWERGTSTNSGGMSWQDVPGTPIVIGDIVYYYSSQHLRMVDLKTGTEIKSVMVYGKPVSQFFINIAYGEGKIFFPCQTDNLDDSVTLKGCFYRVYDAVTLKQLYVTDVFASGQFQSPTTYHGGYVVTGVYGRNGLYGCFTAADDDPARPDEIKPILWKISPGTKYGFSFNGAAFVGDYCYFGCESKVYIANYKTGEYKTFDIGEGYSIRSTITYSAETKRLYVAANHPDGHAAVFSYGLKSDGIPDVGSLRFWVSDTEGGGTQSTPVVYKNRLYIGGGGSTMGSYEPFHVIDAQTMKEIYSVPILSKGSACISTAYATGENNWQVLIYMVPYTPNAKDNSELWIISDSQGQTRAKYEIIDNVGRSQYCSQSLIMAHDGSLIWYNDGGYLYCYENTAGIFSDTAAHWAREEIAYAVRNKIAEGVGDNRFCPEVAITRAEFVQMLANMSGDSLKGLSTSAFSDLGSEWFAPAVAWAVNNGIVDTSEGIFAPYSPITREDMVLMLYRYATKKEKKQVLPVNKAVSFTDISAVSADKTKAIYAMQQGGIVNGIASGSTFRFEPSSNATRAQAAAVIVRFCKSLEG